MINYIYITLIFLACIIGAYLIGSISFALIVSRINNVDLHKIGSGNAGGTNVGRALGKKWAFLTIGLDVAKTLIPMWVVFFVFTLTPAKDFVLNMFPSFHLETIYYTTGLASGIGHTYPLYYKFKGGKAMSCYSGFILATNWFLAALGLTFFLLVYKWKKKVSLSSILGTAFVFLLSLLIVFLPIGKWTLGGWWFGGDIMFNEKWIYCLYLLVYGLFVVYCHRTNIKRLVNKTEPETHYRKD